MDTAAIKENIKFIYSHPIIHKIIEINQTDWLTKIDNETFAYQKSRFIRLEEECNHESQSHFFCVRDSIRGSLIELLYTFSFNNKPIRINFFFEFFNNFLYFGVLVDRTVLGFHDKTSQKKLFIRNKIAHYANILPNWIKNDPEYRLMLLLDNKKLIIKDSIINWSA